MRNYFPAATPKRAVGPSLFLLCVLPLCLVSCARKTGIAVPGAPKTPVVSSVSRVVIPADGGRTISLPRLMDDAITLWSPLNNRERRTPVKKFDAGAQTGGALASRLPPMEQDITRRYLLRLTGDYRELTTRVLARAKTHLPTVIEGVRRRGLPPEIACLPLVESAFEPNSVSRAGAAGIWQLMPHTARNFGLRVDNSVDERFDVYKATETATAYLAYLYSLFQDWPLALAAYNCGEGKMRKALARAKATSLDGLLSYCRETNAASPLLMEETLNYVPRFVAAVQVMTRAEGLGLSAAPLFARPVNPMPEQSGHAGKLRLSGRYDADGRDSPVLHRSKRVN
ncbi:MAG: lytic transglycosylase domain-containing protein [Desulfovibrio sp.]|nr:lytic transglycosylase domain-containing protein [Desulfovibrio sp.]